STGRLSQRSTIPVIPHIRVSLQPPPASRGTSRDTSHDTAKPFAPTNTAPSLALCLPPRAPRARPHRARKRRTHRRGLRRLPAQPVRRFLPARRAHSYRPSPTLPQATRSPLLRAPYSRCLRDVTRARTDRSVSGG